MQTPPCDAPGGFPYAQVLAPCAERININGEIMALYLDQLLPGITAPEDDGNYGSAACYDVLCLQASRSPGTGLVRVLFRAWVCGAGIGGNVRVSACCSRLAPPTLSRSNVLTCWLRSTGCSLFCA